MAVVAAPAVAVTADSAGGFPLAFDFERLETGSSVTMRAFGAGNGAISMLSIRFTRFRHDMVGFIVVGLVKVDVSI